MASSGTMKAVYLQRSEPGATPSITLEERPMPTLTPGNVIVKVHASPIQPSDIVNRRGGFPYTVFPRVPGRDFAGTIVEGPAERIGQEVYGTSGYEIAFTQDGFHAEYALVPETAVAPKPKSLSFEQAACLGVPFTTAWTILERGQVKPSDTVLVIGANGAVGSSAVQLARGRGCRVLTAARNDDSDINTSKDASFEGITALTDGKGVDVVIDTVGQPALTRAAVLKLAKRGRLVFITAPRTGAAGSTELTVEMTNFYRDEKSLIGCNTLLYSVKEMGAVLQQITEMFDKGALDPLQLGGAWKTAKLDDAVDVYEAAGKPGGGKYVFVL
ncbi:chaperonin 10-like protein [Xylogone sp. PMI_703]|nr:chaperonin 10-like protein [Xylogone sp. PMI_703]